MKTTFYEGQEVQVIWFDDAEGSHFKVGEFEVEKITVVMEYGQMAGVPWFAIWKDGKINTKWNGAFIAGVEL